MVTESCVYHSVKKFMEYTTSNYVIENRTNPVFKQYFYTKLCILIKFCLIRFKWLAIDQIFLSGSDTGLTCLAHCLIPLRGEKSSLWRKGVVYRGSCYTPVILKLVLVWGWEI